jgi:hypothetical protein
MPDTIGVSADASFLAYWCRLVEEAGSGAVAVPLLGGSQRPVDRWLVVLDRQEAMTYRFWLRSLAAPIAVVTSSMSASYPLVDRVPLIRLLCHTSRAMASLADVLAMAQNISAGSLVLGPITPSVVRGSPSVGGLFNYAV